MVDIRHFSNTGFKIVTWFHVAKARLEFLPLLLLPPSQFSGIANVSHHAWLYSNFFIMHLNLRRMGTGVMISLMISRDFFNWAFFDKPMSWLSHLPRWLQSCGYSSPLVQGFLRASTCLERNMDPTTQRSAEMEVGHAVNCQVTKGPLHQFKRKD